MWKKIEKFLLQKSSDFIGIDIGTGAIKLVEIAWLKGVPVLKNFSIKELPEKIIEDGLIIDRQQLTETLRQLLATTRIHSKNVVMAVGGRIMFARELIFPAMTMEELGEAIKWDLEKYIPYAPGTYYFDFSIVGQGDTDTEIKVLLVASPLDHINNLIEMIKSVGLKLAAIDVEPLALYRIFDDADQSMVIDIGALLSQVTIFHNGSPAVIRNIPIGGRNFTNIIMQALSLQFNEAEDMKQQYKILGQEEISPEYVEVKKQFEFLVEEFTRDIRRTAEYFQQQHRNVILNKVFITGGGAKLNHLVESLATSLGMPAVMHDPLVKLNIPHSFDENYLKQVAPQLGTAIGLALRGGDL
ncbi:type IV pilus assembly protein PilM [Pelosinus sp. sgz500959]|uniref:type IV pilus assembly protein PilM n=1 Tax=Pelosinus sp. sgz500959 TaxID=3242472 RepID=UPI003670B2F3